MTQKNMLFSVCTVLMAVILFNGCVKKNEKVLRIHGSRTMQPIINVLAETYEKNHNGTVKFVSSGSLKGIASLLNGECDIAATSIKMPAQQVWEFQKKGIVLKECIIAYDIITPIIHPSNSIKNLFLGQLGDIYTGLIKDWKNVEGKSGKITVIDRDDSSGTKLLMSEKFFESKTVVEGSIAKKYDNEVVSYIAKHPAAIGYISKRNFNKNVKAIMINGFNATLDNIEKGYYPLYRELYVYVDEKSYTGDLKSIIDYLMSKKGQDLIEKSGFISVTRLNKPVK